MTTGWRPKMTTGWRPKMTTGWRRKKASLEANEGVVGGGRRRRAEEGVLENGKAEEVRKLWRIYWRGRKSRRRMEEEKFAPGLFLKQG
uniref:Uncharacterized protein n=1 Tax=Cucumis melo TaxID=3656 RepID=A0A9I9CZB4_CUCME